MKFWFVYKFLFTFWIYRQKYLRQKTCFGLSFFRDFENHESCESSCNFWGLWFSTNFPRCPDVSRPSRQVKFILTLRSISFTVFYSLFMSVMSLCEWLLKMTFQARSCANCGRWCATLAWHVSAPAWTLTSCRPVTPTTRNTWLTPTWDAPLSPGSMARQELPSSLWRERPGCGRMVVTTSRLVTFI